MSKVKRYELWEEDGGNSHSFFPEDNKSARDLLSKDARLVWAIEAASWDEAQVKKHEYLGLEPYKPMK